MRQNRFLLRKRELLVTYYVIKSIPMPVGLTSRPTQKASVIMNSDSIGVGRQVHRIGGTSQVNGQTRDLESTLSAVCFLQEGIPIPDYCVGYRRLVYRLGRVDIDKAICTRRGEVPSPVIQREMAPPTIQAESIVGRDSYLDKILFQGRTYANLAHGGQIFDFIPKSSSLPTIPYQGRNPCQRDL